MSQKKKNKILYNNAFINKEDIFYRSLWVQKYISKLMLNGKRHLAEKHVNSAFSFLKFMFKKNPGMLLLRKVILFRPVLSYVNKRMGRKFNSIPIPIKERRQYILSLDSIVKYTKSIENRTLKNKITTALSDLFDVNSKKNYITRKIADDVKHLTDSRVFLHLRWK